MNQILNSLSVPWLSECLYSFWQKIYEANSVLWNMFLRGEGDITEL